MSRFYPQVALQLRVKWENFGLEEDTALNTEAIFDSVLAKRVTVNINDYNEADTFTAELDYNTFPFDPRSLRAVGITIYAQDQLRLYNRNGSPSQIQPSEDNAIFQGFADEDMIQLDESSQTVTLEGRDFTALLLDEEWVGVEVGGKLTKQLPLTDSLDVIIETILSDKVTTSGIRVETRGLDDVILPTLSELGGYKDVQKANNRNKKKNESKWDVIQDLAARAGLIAFIELDRLVLTKPRTLYSEKEARQFIYGRNLRSLKFQRKLGRVKDFNIRVVSLNLRDKELIEARIPEEATDEFVRRLGIQKKRVQVEKQGVKGSTETQDAPFFSFRLPNIVDKPHLIDVGETIFEELGRQQIEGTLVTREMATRQGESEDQAQRIDLTKLRNGSPLKIEIDKSDLSAIKRISSSTAKTQFLIARGYNRQVAAALGKALGKLATIFYTKSVVMTIDQEDGFTLEVDFVNFIETSQKSSTGGYRE